VPYPWAADNHQEYNARYVCERGAGVLVPDSELENTFRDVLVDLMQDREKREKMSSASRKLGRPSASAKVVERIICLKE
jgi:UDP-N-acetylglucosamine--N-acetylmuramyl-(pentapeptide) pyrophosphoryl-undecaprenol N-acetylglucosamine transferase